MTAVETAIEECFEFGGFISFSQLYHRVVEKVGSHTITPQETKNILLELMPQEDIFYDEKFGLYKRRR